MQDRANTVIAPHQPAQIENGVMNETARAREMFVETVTILNRDGDEQTFFPPRRSRERERRNAGSIISARNRDW